MRTIYTSALLEVSVSEDGQLARIRRTAVTSRAAEPGEIEAFAAAVAKLPTERMAALVDLRDAPGRNDDQFERDILPAFQAVLARFARRALLVRTEVGKIQAKRLQRERRGDGAIFTDEAEARRFLETSATPKP